MAALTLQNVSPSGLNPTFAAVNASDTVKISTGQRAFLHVKNNHATVATNVTITARTTSATVSGVGSVTIENQVVAVPAQSERIIGPFTEAFIDTDGNVTIGYSSTTTVTAAALNLPAQY